MSDLIKRLNTGCDHLLDEGDIKKCNAYLMCLCQEAADALEDKRVVIGDFFIAPGYSEGKIWIGRETGERAGEGGDFNQEALSEAIRRFYEERF